MFFNLGENIVNRIEIANLILFKLNEHKEILIDQYQENKHKIGYFYIDDLLPEDLLEKIYKNFPKPENMKIKKSLREFKYIDAQMDQHDKILEETIYAFQDSRIVQLIHEITGIDNLEPDENLYAGGISMMGDKQFLNPHLDNSHDKDRNKWRVLNLLFYVTPDWEENFGGNLEIWPDGLSKKQITIHSKYNRLAVMATHDCSWHSVSPITSIDKFRCCISNYYFSESPINETDTFHVTSFRGRPEQPVVDILLQADIALRSTIRKIFPKGVVKNKHVYIKKDE